MTTGARVTLGTGAIDKVFANLILESIALFLVGGIAFGVWPPTTLGPSPMSLLGNFGLGQSVGGCFHSLIDLTYDMHWPASALVVPWSVAMALVP
jgi:hypothetical protein